MAASPSGDIDGTGGLGFASSSWIQPRFALGPDVVRALTAPETIWMVPAPPAVRESLPESVNFSPAPPAAGFEMMILPVVHGRPVLVALLVGPGLLLGVAVAETVDPAALTFTT